MLGHDKLLVLILKILNTSKLRPAVDTTANTNKTAEQGMYAVTFQTAWVIWVISCCTSRMSLLLGPTCTTKMKIQILPYVLPQTGSMAPGRGIQKGPSKVPEVR